MVLRDDETMNKYQEMRVLAAVVDAGSFVGAADAPSMSKAAVSRYVADLELRLAVRLLHRTTRKLSLTDDSKVFNARCREILSSIEASEAEISARAASASGLLKLSVPMSFGVKHLAPLLAGFMASHRQSRSTCTSLIANAGDARAII
jgi:DNA-binding transcriptional LysR family regulator